VTNWTRAIRNTVFTPKCLLCHAPASLALDLCEGCVTDLPWQQHACRNCALPLPAAGADAPCSACLQRPRFDAAIAAFAYATPVDWLITQLKFHRRLAHARVLGSLLAQRITSSAPTLPDSIVPTPLHPRRYRQRGYNQATLLARHAARALQLPVTPHLARRIRDTAPQMTLPASQRQHNLHAAFAADSSCCNRHIAIVDDVVTTGHTADALAQALRHNGAASVQVWCIARA